MERRWLRKHDPQVDPEELMRMAASSLEETRRRQPYVNFLTEYLERRKGQNGFGQDFEITLRPRRS